MWICGGVTCFVFFISFDCLSIFLIEWILMVFSQELSHPNPTSPQSLNPLVTLYEGFSTYSQQRVVLASLSYVSLYVTVLAGKMEKEIFPFFLIFKIGRAHV